MNSTDSVQNRGLHVSQEPPRTEHSRCRRNHAGFKKNSSEVAKAARDITSVQNELTMHFFCLSESSHSNSVWATNYLPLKSIEFFSDDQITHLSSTFIHVIFSFCVCSHDYLQQDVQCAIASKSTTKPIVVIVIQSVC